MEYMISTYMQKLRLFNRDVRLYLVSWAIVGFNHMGIIAVLFNLYMLRLGHGPELVGVVNGTGWFAFSLSSLPAGALGKRWGSRTLMIVGMSVVTIGVGLTLAVELLPFSWQPIWLVSTYVLTLVGAALYFVSTMPFLTSATTEEERSHAYGIRTALNNFSGFVGSLVAGILPGLFASFLNSTLDDPAPYRYPLWISCILYAACVIILFRTSKRETSEDINPMSSAHAKDEANKVAPYALIALIAIVMLLTSVGSATINNFFNVYLDTELAVSTLLIGVLSAIKQLLSVLLALSAPILMARWEKDRIITFGFFITDSPYPTLDRCRLGLYCLSLNNVTLLASYWSLPAGKCIT